MQQLSLSARPRTLDDLVGQQKTVESIRGLVGNQRLPKAFLFSGPTGSGKTSVARVLALSLQCVHQDGSWGRPCKQCQANAGGFQIHEINAADLSGKEDIRRALDGSDYAPFSGSRYRVYILDEIHKLSSAAQSFALKLLEDTPESTKFVLCTTHPQNVIETIRSRCAGYSLRELNSDEILLLVVKLLKKIRSTLPAENLADALVEHRVRYPRWICQAVDRYAGGVEPEEAARIDVVQEVDTRALTKAVTKGDWESVSRYLLNAQASDIKSIRMGLLAYLRTVLLESPEPGPRGDAVAKAISALAALQNAEDLTLSAAVAAELYRLTELFGKYKL